MITASGYQHARRTHTIAAFNFLHHVFADDPQQALFAFGHSARLDIEDAERANRKVVAAERKSTSSSRIEARASIPPRLIYSTLDPEGSAFSTFVNGVRLRR